MSEYLSGFDVSHHNQYYVNYKEAKAAGMDFVILRSSYGLLVDGTFEWQYNQAWNAGFKDIRAYHYIYPKRGINQVYTFLKAIEDFPAIKVVYPDVEEARPIYTVPTSQWSDLVQHILGVLFGEYGTENTGIYTSRSKWKATVGNYVPRAEMVTRWWVAHYTSRMPPYAPALPEQCDDWEVWQYTAYGRVPWYRDGKYNIDLNRARKMGSPTPPAYQVTVTHPVEVSVEVIQQ